ncbi:hypothetical protein SAMN04489735_102528 [Aneurinibacillus thermoaerophilus]|uniref:Uncharacterized protein n=1 Tax=Aneurinibacillus thermoaerophilus TaxID=143495 RepID=A0A1G8CFM7_ANETH|nr:hypothetical protein SAMN04489735_102528 [Aneurinibacillus thermoaerophilus]
MGMILYALGYMLFPIALFFGFMYLSKLTTRE